MRTKEVEGEYTRAGKVRTLAMAEFTLKSYEACVEQRLIFPDLHEGGPRRCQEWFTQTFREPDVQKRMDMFRNLYPMPCGDRQWWPVSIIHTGQPALLQDWNRNAIPDFNFTRKMNAIKNLHPSWHDPEHFREALGEHLAHHLDNWDRTFTHRTPQNPSESGWQVSVDRLHEVTDGKPLAACFYQMSNKRCSPLEWPPEAILCWVLEHGVTTTCERADAEDLAFFFGMDSDEEGDMPAWEGLTRPSDHEWTAGLIDLDDE